MRKVILFNMMTLDGYFAGPNGEIDWHNVDSEFNDFAIEQLNSMGGIIFGRETYQMMASYWPTPGALENDPQVANKMNELPKFVFSKTLKQASWNNTQLLTGEAAADLKKLKEMPGKDLFIFGSAHLAATFLQAGLIDEYRVMVNPIVIGSGKPLFQGIKDPLKLKLHKSKTFENGNVLLYYQGL